MAILHSDTFTRANSTTVLGTPDVGGPYTFFGGGVWGINNNEAYLSTAAAGAQAAFPAAFNIDISIRLAVTPTSTVVPGLMIRWVDASNHWLLQTRSSPFGLMLYRCVAGVYTNVADTTIPAMAINDVIGLKAYGDQIAWLHNGRTYGVITDQWAANGASIATMRNGGSGVARFDNLLAQDQTSPIGQWPNAEGSDLTPDLTLAAAPSAIPSLYKGRDTALADESEIS